MSKVVLKAEYISKQYRLGLVGTGTVKDDMKRWWYKLRGMEDPFLKIGEANDRSTKGESDYVWSLRDINFEINQGDSVGIIGRNGAGKSTLLKILSQVTQPTTGKIYTKGRIASLLEVGTGFHPEMTGRENIYLNGAILGMRKKEITRKLDEIIDFSGVERYIDTPVKRYSSGMYVRLAFAVAAHLESEILIVDEVLAVGDAEFQKKCLGKMNDVSKGEGRTVLFVSHNMAAIRGLCSRGIVLENGLIKFNGNTENALDIYNSNNNLAETEINLPIEEAPGNQNAKIRSARVYSKSGLNYIEEDIFVEIIFENFKEKQTLNVSLSIFDDKDNYLVASPNLDRKELKPGIYKSVCKINKNIFNTGKHFFTILLVGDNFQIIVELDKVISIDLIEEGTKRGDYYGHWSGLIRPYFEWSNFKD
jgi:lipopolysaccharide transport system ATP-binding protein